MLPYYQSRVIRLGDEAIAMVEGGVLILFQEPVPPELAQLSVIHSPFGNVSQPVTEGDVLQVGDTTLTITGVGDRAEDNLRCLGHLVVYVNPGADTGLLPGAIHATGNLSLPHPGERIELYR